MKRFLIAAVTGLTLFGSNAARADLDVDISIGIPGVIYERPHYHRHPPPRVVVVPDYRERPVVVYSNRYYYDEPHKRHKHWKDKHWRSEHRRHDRDYDRRHWDD